MKWLKKFEELSPELIRRAGNMLIAKGHSERGLNLLDKSYSGNSFNVWITDNGSFLDRLPKENSNTGRSEPLPLSYNFSSSKFYFYPRNSTFELRDEGMDAEKLIQFWVEGKCNLAFIIDFYFTPTKETIKNVKFGKKNFSREVPLFSINFLIHRKLVDSDNILKEKLSKDSTYIQTYFNEVYKAEPKITLFFPNAKDLQQYSAFDNKKYDGTTEYGLFSDRKSAFNFKNNVLPKVMDDQADKIMDILSIINIKSDKADEILNFYKRVKLNYLYRSEIPHYVNNARDTEDYFFGENLDKDIRY